MSHKNDKNFCLKKSGLFDYSEFPDKKRCYSGLEVLGNLLKNHDQNAREDDQNVRKNDHRACENNQIIREDEQINRFELHNVRENNINACEELQKSCERKSYS